MRIAKRKLVKVGGAILAALLLLWFAGRLVAWGACSWYGYQTDRETRYAAFIGCMVELDGKWYPRNELRVVQ